MRIIGGERMRPMMNTRKLRKQIDSVAVELDKVQDRPDEWPEEPPEQPSADLKSELQKCAELRAELHSFKHR